MSTEALQAEAVSTDEYLDLVRAFPLRPIRTEADYDRAIAILNAISDKPRAARSLGDSDYFLVLALIVEHYEEKVYPDPLGTGWRESVDPTAPPNTRWERGGDEGPENAPIR